MGLTLAVFIKDVPQITPGRLIELNWVLCGEARRQACKCALCGKCDNYFSPHQFWRALTARSDVKTERHVCTSQGETNPPKETNAKCHVLTMKRQWALCRERAKKNKTKKQNSLRLEKTEYCIKTNIKTVDKAMYKKTTKLNSCPSSGILNCILKKKKTKNRRRTNGLSDGTVKTEWRWLKGEGVHTQQKKKKLKNARMSAQSDQSGAKTYRLFPGWFWNVTSDSETDTRFVLFPHSLSSNPPPDERRSNTALNICHKFLLNSAPVVSNSSYKHRPGCGAYLTAALRRPKSTAVFLRCQRCQLLYMEHRVSEERGSK